MILATPKHTATAAPAEFVPDCVSNYCGQNSVYKNLRRTQPTRTRKGSGGEQKGSGRNGQAQLLSKHEGKERSVPVPHQELDRVIHRQDEACHQQSIIEIRAWFARTSHPSKRVVT